MARIKDLPEITAAQLTNNDEFVVNPPADNKEKRIKWSSLLTKIFGGKTIGGAATTDITQNNATQELSNKKLTKPKINSNTSTNATSEDLNKLHLVTVSAGQLNHLAGCHSNIQEQLNAKEDIGIEGAHPMLCQIRIYADEGGEIGISETLIREKLQLPAHRRISKVMAVAVWEAYQEPWRLIPCCEVFLQPSAAGYLDHIQVTGVNSGELCQVVITCSVITV